MTRTSRRISRRRTSPNSRVNAKGTTCATIFVLYCLNEERSKAFAYGPCIEHKLGACDHIEA